MKKLSLTFCFLLLVLFVKAQITQDIPPPKWNTQTLQAESSSTIQLPQIDFKSIIEEDSIESLHKDIPWRFGVAIDREIDVLEEGQRSSNGNMSRIELRLSSPQAKSLNLNFDEFYLPKGSLLYIKSTRGKDAIGALSHHNNKADGKFSTRPLKGSSLLIDLYVPTDSLDRCRLQIGQVVHAYKDVFAKSSKTFGGSGNCNRNINCPEADLWQDVKRSVVIILASNNTRLCTGTLMNNVRQDSTPYLLTASHCNLATNSIFVFNYENSSSSCTQSADSNLNHSISGGISRAESSYSDFKLFELSQTPPASYNVYYAGWSAENVAAFESTTIHHPSGDIKKFSQDYDTAVSAFYSPGNSDTHWQVGNWETGTTERGSSGAPLFDQYKRVVGQLEGGAATCAQNLNDYFGKVAVSWTHNPAANRQLKRWLDPDTSNQLTLNGLDPHPKALGRDIELTYVSNVPTVNCDSSITPGVHVMNVGNDTIPVVVVNYGTNNSHYTYFWQGSLKTEEIIHITLPTFKLQSTDSLIYVNIDVNGGDQDTSDNNWTQSIQANLDPVFIPFKIKTDQYGYETSWEIKDVSTQKVIAKGGPYVETADTTGQVYRDTLCLYDGCFDFVLYDAFGDGFNGFFGDGYVLIQGQRGDTLLIEKNFTGSQKTINFCVQDTATTITEYQLVEKVKVFPNPVRRGQILNIDHQSDLLECRLIGIDGREVFRTSSTSFQLPNKLSKGIYIVEVRDRSNAVLRSKLLVQ